MGSFRPCIYPDPSCAKTWRLFAYQQSAEIYQTRCEMAIRWCVSKLIPFLAATAYSGSSSATTTTTNDLTPEEKDLAGSALAGWRLLGLAPSSRHLRQSSESINNATIYAKMFVRNFLSEDLSDGVGAVYGGNGSPLEVPSTVVAGSEAAFLATAAGNSAGISGTASWRIGDGRETPTHVVIMWSVPWSMVFRTNYLAVGLRSSETYDSNETFEQMYAEEVSECTYYLTELCYEVSFHQPSWFARIDAGKADIMARSGNILTYGQTFPYYAKSFTPTYRVSVVSTDERRNARLSLKKSVNMTSEVSQDQLQVRRKDGHEQQTCQEQMVPARVSILLATSCCLHVLAVLAGVQHSADQLPPGEPLVLADQGGDGQKRGGSFCR